MQVAVYHIESAGQTDLYCLQTFSGFAVEIFYYGETLERLESKTKIVKEKYFIQKKSELWLDLLCRLFGRQMLTSRRISLAFTEVICKIRDFRERGDSQKISFSLTLRWEVSFWTSRTDSEN